MSVIPAFRGGGEAGGSGVQGKPGLLHSCSNPASSLPWRIPETSLSSISPLFLPQLLPQGVVQSPAVALKAPSPSDTRLTVGSLVLAPCLIK